MGLGWGALRAGRRSWSANVRVVGMAQIPPRRRTWAGGLTLPQSKGRCIIERSIACRVRSKGVTRGLVAQGEGKLSRGREREGGERVKEGNKLWARGTAVLARSSSHLRLSSDLYLSGSALLAVLRLGGFCMLNSAACGVCVLSAHLPHALREWRSPVMQRVARMPVLIQRTYAVIDESGERGGAGEKNKTKHGNYDAAALTPRPSHTPPSQTLRRLQRPLRPSNPPHRDLPC
jgi:hypothetical protein